MAKAVVRVWLKKGSILHWNESKWIFLMASSNMTLIPRQHLPAEPEVWPQFIRIPKRRLFNKQAVYNVCENLPQRSVINAFSCAAQWSCYHCVIMYYGDDTEELRYYESTSFLDFFKFIMKSQHLLPCQPSVLQQPEIWGAHVLWITTQIDPGIDPK